MTYAYHCEKTNGSTLSLLLIIDHIGFLPRYTLLILSKNFKYSLADFAHDAVIPFLASDTEKQVYTLVKQWVKGQQAFVFHTSGSTGSPKEIKIDRDKIIQSTRYTFDFIDPKRQIKNSLLCLDPHFIGGAMVVFRALIMGLDLYITTPSSSILSDLPDNFQIDLTSLVPLQYHALSDQELNKFKVILIGGAPLPSNTLSRSNATAYATFGMTETVSHIALRKIGQSQFTTIGDMKVDIHSDGCLQFKGSMTHNKWLKTNDIGKSTHPTTFEWLGRKDFVINSGGIKLHPEQIEDKLRPQIEGRFLIISLPDKSLGQKLILILENQLLQELDYSTLSKYEQPKNIFENHPFELTKSGKIDRKKTRQSLIDSLQ